MSSDGAPLYFRHMIEGIDSVESFISRMGFEEFRGDPKTVAAVERMLMVISEAATRLGEAAPEHCPDVPWPRVRDLGKTLHHEYDHVDPRSIWSTINEDLPPLKVTLTEALQRMRELE